jgi:hypothetical protein
VAIGDQIVDVSAAAGLFDGLLQWRHRHAARRFSIH